VHRERWERFDVALVQFQANRIFLDALDLGDRDSHVLFTPQMALAQHEVSDMHIRRINQKFPRSTANSPWGMLWYLTCTLLIACGTRYGNNQ